MNQSDKLLFQCVLLSAFLFFCIFQLIPKEKGSIAVVTYQNQKVLEIDLSQNKTYQVDGKNGKITIVVKNGKIKVAKENSPYHVCSKQGYIESSNESLVCLPNELIITIQGKSDVDTIVK